MAELPDTVTIPAPLGYAAQDMYFTAGGGDTQYMQAVRIVPPESKTWDVIGLAWTYIGTNWLTPGAATAKGSGGILKFTVHNPLADGTPNLTAALATEQLAADDSGPGAGGNAYRYYQRTRAMFGITTNSMLIHMSIPAGLAVVAGQPVWVVIRNMHLDPANHSSGPSWLTSRNTFLLPDGTVKIPPNHVNTTVATANYAIQGLDPRETVASKTTAASAWLFGREAGRVAGDPAGADNGNHDARVPTYFWRELGSTRVRAKVPFDAYRVASLASPSVTRTDAVSAFTLKYWVAYPTTSGSCQVTAEVLNPNGSVKQTVVGTSSAAAPTGGSAVVGTFPSNVVGAVGDGLRLSCTKAVWTSIADPYLRRLFDRSDDWVFGASDAPNYPGIAAFGVRGVADWPWGYTNRQAAATGAAGAVAVASNLAASTIDVRFEAERGVTSISPKIVRVTDTANGNVKGFTAISNASWLTLRAGETGTPSSQVTTTADTDLYLFAANQTTNGNYTATVSILPSQSGDTVPPVAVRLSVTDPQSVRTYDSEIAEVATRFWKLEETTGLFADTMGGAGLALTGTGVTRGIDVNVPEGPTFVSQLDSFGANVVAHWPLGDAAPTGSGSVSYVGVQSFAGVTGASGGTMQWPANTQVGDVAVLMLHVEAAGSTPAVTSGGATAWAQKGGTQSPANGDKNTVWTKRVEAADLTGDITLAWGMAVTYQSAVVGTYRGGKASGDPINQAQGATGSSLTPGNTGFTTTAPCRLVHLSAQRLTQDTAPPAGFTERHEATNTEVYLADMAQSVAGATGAISATMPVSDQWASFLIAIEPEAGGTVDFEDRKNGRDATPNGTVTRSVGTLLNDGTTDPSIQVGGTDAAPTTGHLEVPATTAFQTSAFTALVWAKVTGGQGTSRVLFRHRDAGTGIARGWYIVASSVNTWRYLAGLSDNTFVTVEGPAVQVGQTVFLAATFEGGVPKLYVNGAVYTATPSAAYNQTHSTNRPLRIGAGTNETTASAFFRGVIDEAALMNVTLNAQQIQALYAAGS
jgi:hypothetical protein